MALDDLKEQILKLNKKLILIAWPSASWKTYIANQIKQYLENLWKKVILISTDDYYKDNTLMYYILYGTYDHPNLINFKLLNKNLFDLLNWTLTKKPIYSFEYKMIVDWQQLKPEYDFIIVEWLYTLNFVVKKLLTQAFKVFIDVEKEELILRRIIRDPQRTKEPLDRILNSMVAVFPMWNIYWENQKKKADYIYKNDYYIIKDKWNFLQKVEKIPNENLEKVEVKYIVDYYYWWKENNWYLIVREIYQRWFFKGVSILKQYRQNDAIKTYEVFINQPWFLKEAHNLMQIAWLKYKWYEKWKLKILKIQEGKYIVFQYSKWEQIFKYLT